VKFLIQLLACVALAAPVLADQTVPTAQRYVTDTIWIQLRSGPSSQYRILQTLKTGEKLALIEEDKDKGYSRVRSAKGNEGWVLTQYITGDAPAQILQIQNSKQLENTTAELEAARQKMSEMETRLASITKEYSDYKEQAGNAIVELEQLKAISGNAIALDDKNKKLTMSNQELEIQVEALRTENLSLRDDRRTSFLIYGGGLILVGIFAGLIMPSLRGNRNRSSGWA
jgi:SH3 domain protein